MLLLQIVFSGLDCSYRKGSVQEVYPLAGDTSFLGHIFDNRSEPGALLFSGTFFKTKDWSHIWKVKMLPGPSG
jgi:hypothetical protein